MKEHLPAGRRGPSYLSYKELLFRERGVCPMARIILGSGSPRRQELLRRIGIEDFIVRVPDVEE